MATVMQLDLRCYARQLTKRTTFLPGASERSSFRRAYMHHDSVGLVILPMVETV